MVKKRGPGRPRKSVAKPTKPAEHQVPHGFWAQIGAIFLILIAVLIMVGLVGAGGALPVNFAKFMRFILGWTAFILPFVFIWQAVQIFRSDENRLSGVVWLATILFAIFFAGLFQLMLATPLVKSNVDGGGLIGFGLDNILLQLLNVPVAALILAVLLMVLTFFVLSIAPKAVLNKLRAFFGHEQNADDAANERVAGRLKDSAKTTDTSTESPDKSGPIKLNKGVETVDHSGDKPDKLRRVEAVDDSPKSALTIASDPNWEFPSLDLLEKKQRPADAGDVQHNAEIIRETLSEFNINVDMEGANIGPKVTQYTLRPPSGVKLSRITNVADSLALNLAARSLRIEAPIPGKRSVGIEVPNVRPADVRLYSILHSEQWRKAKEPLSFAVGLDIAGDAVIGELNKMPHLVIAGQTGSGKSVMINSLICSLLYRNTPADMKLILVDPKQVEMTPYDNIPNLLTPVITDPEKTISALKWAVQEMDQRYTSLADERVRDVKTYNAKMRDKGEPIMPYIVIVIDEMADLMMLAKRDVEALIVRLAQKARAVGIHLVLATQRPSVDVITGLIKANVPARIAFTVASQVDSRTILDQVGAEKLLGAGDMLVVTPQMSKPKRVQGAFVTDSEVIKITDFLRQAAPPDYNPDIISQQVAISQKGGIVMDMAGGSDSEFRDAVRVVVEARKASTSLLQRRLRIGYGKAARIMEEMEDRGIIGPQDGSRPREVLISSLDDIQE
ncbi:MAG: DNA translocase FtsK 4TM domain-containing protein [Candidatus Nanoperiomorbaceae bacterium]